MLRWLYFLMQVVLFRNIGNENLCAPQPFFALVAALYYLKYRHPMHINKDSVDFFISHASEDKEKIARPLAEELSKKGFKVWYDDFSLKLGDTLRRTIEKGIRNCKYGVVILSPNFFAKEWPQKELDGLIERESKDGEKIVLPVWHDITVDAIREISPALADKVGVSTTIGIAEVADKITDVVRPSIDLITLNRNTSITEPILNSIYFYSSEDYLGRLIIRFLTHYKVYDESQKNLDKLLKTAKEDISKFGVNSNIEDLIFDRFRLLLPDLFNDPDMAVVNKSCKKDINKWLHGLYFEYEWRLRIKSHKVNFAIEIDFSDDFMILDFFPRYNSITKEKYKQSILEYKDDDDEWIQFMIDQENYINKFVETNKFKIIKNDLFALLNDFVPIVDDMETSTLTISEMLILDWKDIEESVLDKFTPPKILFYW